VTQTESVRANIAPTDFENNKQLEQEFDFDMDDGDDISQFENKDDLIDEKMSDKMFLKLRGKIKKELMKDFHC